MLNDNVDEVKQRGKKSVIRLIRQQEAGRRHGREQLEDFGTCARRRTLKIGSDIIQDDKQSRINCFQIPFTRRDQALNRLI